MLTKKRKIIKKIQEYETIIIHRHSRPDMDAIGSQLGLALTLKNKFPSKRIYVVGDLNDMSFDAKMDDIADETYKGALAIITDVAVSNMVSDDRYKLAKELIIIDHHQNDTDITNNVYYKDTSYSSACEMIVDLFKTLRVTIPKDAATYLYTGMVTDTGRFMFLTTPLQVFKMVSYVCKFEPDIKKVYDYLYVETLSKRKAKNIFSDFKLTKNNVAYRFNTNEMIKESGLDFQGVSRGMVNQMAGIKEVLIWASFTEDISSGKIVCEFRARNLTIVDIAKKYGGGGHNQACGATINSFEDAKKILDDFDERVEEYVKNNTK